MFVTSIRARHVVVTAAVVLIGAGVLSRSLTAFNPQPDPPRFGMVGIAADQTARLNLVNLGIPTPGGLPPDPCRARLKFFDANGNVLAAKTVELKPGEADFLDFSPTFPPVDTAAPPRAEIRGALVPIDTPTPPDPCRATVEIFDNATGHTAVLIPPDPCRGAAACRGVTP